MLLLHGLHKGWHEWSVREEKPPSFSRLYYIKSGCVTYHDDQISRQLTVGHLYVFPTTKGYEMEQAPTDPLACLFLHLDVAPHLVSELLDIPVEEGSFVDHMLCAMEVWIERGTSGNVDFVMNGLAETLVAYLNEQEFLQDIPKKLAETVTYIAEHVKEKITVDQLSALCGYHKQYYIRLFCTYLGSTPHQYLINYRMKLGMYMLMDGKSVAEVAEGVGYSEVRNFIRAFKQCYGYPPKQVQKKGRNLL